MRPALFTTEACTCGHSAEWHGTTAGWCTFFGCGCRGFRRPPGSVRARAAWRLVWRAVRSSAGSLSLPEACDGLYDRAQALLHLRCGADLWAYCSAEAAPYLWPACLRERWLLQRLAILAAHDPARHARIAARYNRDSAPLPAPPVSITCDDCGGHGETDTGCSSCGGTGSAHLTCTGCDGCPHETDDGDCAHCEGRGYVYLSCRSCRGLGAFTVAVRLETRQGDLVAELKMLPFIALPEVVTWGTRTFQLHGDDGTTPVYREVFAFALIDFEALASGAPMIQTGPVEPLRERFPRDDGWIATTEQVGSAFLAEVKDGRYAAAVWLYKDRSTGRIAERAPFAFPNPDELRGAAEAMWRLAGRWAARQKTTASEGIDGAAGGSPLHYSNPRLRAMVAAVSACLGPDIEVQSPDGHFVVQRHYIALHGLKAADLPDLAARGIVRRAHAAASPGGTP